MKQTPLKRKRKRRVARAKKPGRKAMCKRCDDLWRKLILDRDGWTCQVCGKPARYAHHFISRGRVFFRHNLMNGLALCFRCHMGDDDCSAHGAPWAFESCMKMFGRIAQINWWLDNRYVTIPAARVDYEQVYGVLLGYSMNGDPAALQAMVEDESQ